MKKRLLFVLLLSSLALVSCGESNLSDSSNNSASASFPSESASVFPSDSASASDSSRKEELTKEQLLSYLDNQKEFYNVRKDISVKKDNVTYYSYLGRDMLYLNGDTKIYSTSATVTKISDLSINTDTTSTYFSIYKTPTETYTLNASSGKYAVKSENNRDCFTPFTISYDFSKATAFTFTSTSSESKIKGSIDSSSLSSFLKSAKLDSVSDFTFETSIHLVTHEIKTIKFSYTEKGYKITDNREYSSIQNVIETLKVS